MCVSCPSLLDNLTDCLPLLSTSSVSNARTSLSSSMAIRLMEGEKNRIRIRMVEKESVGEIMHEIILCDILHDS